MTNKLVFIINSLKVPKFKKILLHEMKFLVPNYSCLQNPWLGGYRPQIPIHSVLCSQLNLLTPPSPNKIPGYATDLETSRLRRPWLALGRSAIGKGIKRNCCDLSNGLCIHSMCLRKPLGTKININTLGQGNPGYVSVVLPWLWFRCRYVRFATISLMRGIMINMQQKWSSKQRALQFLLYKRYLNRSGILTPFSNRVYTLWISSRIVGEMHHSSSPNLPAYPSREEDRERNTHKKWKIFLWRW